MVFFLDDSAEFEDVFPTYVQLFELVGDVQRCAEIFFCYRFFFGVPVFLEEGHIPLCHQMHEVPLVCGELQITARLCVVVNQNIQERVGEFRILFGVKRPLARITALQEVVLDALGEQLHCLGFESTKKYRRGDLAKCFLKKNEESVLFCVVAMDHGRDTLGLIDEIQKTTAPISYIRQMVLVLQNARMPVDLVEHFGPKIADELVQVVEHFARLCNGGNRRVETAGLARRRQTSRGGRINRAWTGTRIIDHKSHIADILANDELASDVRGLSVAQQIVQPVYIEPPSPIAHNFEEPRVLDRSPHVQPCPFLSQRSGLEMLDQVALRRVDEVLNKNQIVAIEGEGMQLHFELRPSRGPGKREKENSLYCICRHFYSYRRCRPSSSPKVLV